MLSHPFEEQPIPTPSTPVQPPAREQPSVTAQPSVSHETPTGQTTVSSPHKKGYLATMLGIVFPLVVMYLAEKLFLFLFERGMVLNIVFIPVVLALTAALAAYLIHKWYAFIIVPIAAYGGELLYMLLEYPAVLRMSVEHFGSWAVQGFPPFNALFVPIVMPSLLGVAMGLLIHQRWPSLVKGRHPSCRT
jgi:hypothetical protein